MKKSIIISGKINTQKYEVEKHIKEAKGKTLIICDNVKTTYIQKLMAKNKINGVCLGIDNIAQYFYTHIRREYREIANREQMLMILVNVLSKIEKDNLFYNDNHNNDIVDKILDFILEMKSNGTYSLDLEIASDELNGILKNKVSNLSEIINKFDEIMDQSNLITSQEYLLNIVRYIKETIRFDIAIIDVLKEYKPLTIRFLNEIIKSNIPQLIFALNDYQNGNSMYYNIVLRNDHDVKKQIEENLINNDYSIERVNTNDIKLYENNINDIIFNSSKQIDNISSQFNLIKENTIYKEISNIVNKIKKVISSQNIDLNKIVVTSCSMETYFPILEEQLYLNNIPFNDIRKKKINTNIIGRDIEILLTTILDNDITGESIIRIAKTIFFDYDINDLNIIYKRFGNNIDIAFNNASQFYRNQTIVLSAKEKTNTIINLINILSQDFSIKNLSTILNKELYPKVFKKIKEYENIQQNQKAIYLLSEWNQIVSVVDDLKDIKTDEKQMETFLKVLRTGNIPNLIISKNKIIISDLNSSYNYPCDYLFVLGCNEGNLPPKQNVQFLSEQELKELSEKINNSQLGYESLLIKKHHDIIYLITTPFKEITLSYSINSINGEELELSACLRNLIRTETTNEQIIDDEFFLNILTKISELKYSNIIDDKLHNDISLLLNNKKYRTRIINALHNLYIDKTKINSKNIVNTYNKTNGFAVTEIEKYSECPFKHFMYYGIHPKEESSFEENASDKGNFYHTVFYEFYKYITDNNINLKLLDDKIKFNEIIEPIIQKCLLNHNDNVLQSHIIYQYASFKMIRRVKNALWNNILQMNKGEWQPNIFETDVKVILENDLYLTGKIDRVDVLPLSDGVYGRIIDYKSSIKDLTEERLISGLQLQLPLYLHTLKNKVKLAGIYYFPVIDPTKDIDNPNDNIMKKYKLNGFTLDNRNVLNGTDEALKEVKSSSDIIGASISAKDEITKKSKVLKNEEFDDMINKSIEIATKNVENILNNEVKIHPLKLKDYNACEYCPFRTVCHRDATKKDIYRKIDKNKEESI